MSQPSRCPKCESEVIPQSHFCLQCGHMLATQPETTSAVEEPTPQQDALNLSPKQEQAPPPERPAPAAPVAPVRAVEDGDALSVDLVLIRSPELKEVRFKVRDQAQIGRLYGNLIFREDPYISPLHATLFYRGEQLFIRDEGSFNGIFKRIKSPTELKLGEIFIAGEQSYTVEAYGAGGSFLENPAQDDVRFFANPKPKAETPRLTQLIDGGGRGLCASFSEGSLSVGRQGCDLNFPHDRFMSSRHCHISVNERQIMLTDMGSRNGTFIQVNGECPLQVGDFLLIGKQLLQVQRHTSQSQSQVSV